MFEHAPSSEVSDADIVEALKSKGGLEKLDTIGLLFTWTMQEWAKVGPTPRDAVQFNIRRGKIYVLGGYYDEAKQMFQDALLQAEQEVLPDLCDYLAKIIRALNERR